MIFHHFSLCELYVVCTRIVLINFFLFLKTTWEKATLMTLKVIGHRDSQCLHIVKYVIFHNSIMRQFLL